MSGTNLQPDGDGTRQSRLVYLATLQDGWYDGHGRAPSSAAIEEVRQILELLPTALAGRCGIFPTEEGTLIVERVDASRGWQLDLEVTQSGTFEIYHPLQPEDAHRPNGVEFGDAEQAAAYLWPLLARQDAEYPVEAEVPQAAQQEAPRSE